MTLVDESDPKATPITVWHLIHSGALPDVIDNPAGVALIEQPDDQAAWSERMYRRIGAPWSWVDRRDWSARDWQAWVDRPGYWLGLVHVDGEPAGYLELIGSTEIAFLGIDTAITGRGIGRWLLTEGVRRALLREDTERLTVRTCALDHPVALSNYLARGFRIDRTETEWRDVTSHPAQSRS